jgi:phospholipid/cholesterol/gamma-HCH transport system substrate-binding protein
VTGRARVGSLAASPTMVGAITTLIVIVAVFLAYNANQGLPFVPVYRVSAEMCNAARLGPNNEVRVGGTRIGVVESIETIDSPASSGCQTETGSSASQAAKLNLKLDQSAKPIPEDSTIRVRYRSSFGLKYLQVTRGASDTGLPEGGTLPIAQAQQQTEFDDINNTFDTPTRESSRQVLQGFGDAFAARGASLNQAIESLNPLFTNLRPVASALADPTTQLVRFFPELADAARIVAPVAVDNAEQFTHGAIAFGAIASDPDSLRDTISNGPPTLQVGIDSLPVQAPFLRDFAEFSRLLRPGVRDLRVALPVLNDAVSTGVKVLPRTVQMNRDLQGVLTELEQLVDEPSTKSALVRLTQTFGDATPLVDYLVPYQTVCNYWNYFWGTLGEHISQRDQVGFSERIYGILYPPGFGPTGVQGSAGSYSGIATNGRNAFTGEFQPDRLPIFHGTVYKGGVDEQGNADCHPGQYGYPLGDLRNPGQPISDPAFAVTSYPGDPRGTTFTGRPRLP